jgi:hypothetical protein
VLLKKKYDVAVVGAGPAGVCAAVAAARRGVSVLLIDSGATLGGSVTAAMHRCLCGLYSADPVSPCNTLNAGMQRDVVMRMSAKAGITSVFPAKFGRAYVLEFPASAWESALADICAEPKVDLSTNTRAIAVRRKAHCVESLQLGGAADATVAIDALIDCTGGGSVLELVGEDALQPADPASTDMLGGYAIRWARLSGDADMLRLEIPYVLNVAVNENALPHAAKFATFFPGPGEGEGVLKLAIPPDAFFPEQVEPFGADTIRILKERVPAFVSATIVEMSPRALRRDGRRLRGKYIVAEDDVLSARKHGPDAVHAWWPIENWDAEKGPSYTYPPEGDFYDIPPAALQSAVVENLFAAGTCLSATRTAAASTRAGGICLATGGKAGEMAAAG